MMALPYGQIDLSAILGTGAAQPQLHVPPAKPEKKPALSTAQKRVAVMVDILQGKDLYGLHYTKLLLELSPDDIQLLKDYVQRTYNIQ